MHCLSLHYIAWRVYGIIWKQVVGFVTHLLHKRKVTGTGIVNINICTAEPSKEIFFPKCYNFVSRSIKLKVFPRIFKELLHVLVVIGLVSIFLMIVVFLTSTKKSSGVVLKFSGPRSHGSVDVIGFQVTSCAASGLLWSGVRGHDIGRVSVSRSSRHGLL
jgi:hypothetical protein